MNHPSCFLCLPLFPCSHTSIEKLHTHTCTCVRRPVFHWGLIDWKMKTDACARRALLISKRHGVYYSGPAPDPNTSPRQPVSLHCWPPITLLTGWRRRDRCWFGRQQYPLFLSSDTPLSIGEGNGLEMGSVMLSAPASVSNDNRHNTEPLTASLCECLASQTDRQSSRC